jgi:hypothetical protein
MNNTQKREREREREREEKREREKALIMRNTSVPVDSQRPVIFHKSED